MTVELISCWPHDKFYTRKKTRTGFVTHSSYSNLSILLEMMMSIYKGTIPEWVFVRFGLLPREEQHLLYRGLCSAEIPGR